MGELLTGEAAIPRAAGHRTAGWSGLKDENFPMEQLRDDNMRNLRGQLMYLERLRLGMRMLEIQGGFARAFSMARNYEGEHNTQVMMTETAKGILLGDDEMIERINSSMKMIEKLPELSPQTKAMEYLERKY